MLDERVLGIDAFVVLVDPLQRLIPRGARRAMTRTAPALQRDVPLEYDARRDPFPDQLEQPAGLGDREPVLRSPLAPGPDSVTRRTAVSLSQSAASTCSQGMRVSGDPAPLRAT